MGKHRRESCGSAAALLRSESLPSRSSPSASAAGDPIVPLDAARAGGAVSEAKGLRHPAACPVPSRSLPRAVPQRRRCSSAAPGACAAGKAVCCLLLLRPLPKKHSCEGFRALAWFGLREETTTGTSGLRCCGVCCAVGLSRCGFQNVLWIATCSGIFFSPIPLKSARMGFHGTAPLPQASQALVTEAVRQLGHPTHRALDAQQTFLFFIILRRDGFSFSFYFFFPPSIHRAEYL